MTFVPKVARWTVPLMLAPPMLTIGQYGVTIAEFIVVLTGVAFLTLYERAPHGTPTFMVVFLLCWCIGWIGSLYNAYDWLIPVSASNMVFLYSVALAWFAFLVGRYSQFHLQEITTDKVAFAIVLFVGVFAVFYPFVSPATRQLVMTPFINELFYSRLASPRFPGIGVNANVYSFMVYVFLLFSLHAYLAGRGSAIIPLAALAIIIAAAGRTMSVVSISSILVLVLAASRRSARLLLDARRAILARKRSLAIGTLILALTATAIIYGGQVRDAFALYARFQDMFGDSEYSGLKTRTDVWAIGIARLKLAPVLGIPIDPSRVDASNPLYFYTPHNEFIYFWTTFGIVGFFAHIYLLGRMLLANVRARAELPWFLLYGAIFVQMMVDSVFGGPRTIVFIFMVIGLNVKYLRERRGQPTQRTRPRLEHSIA